MVVAAVVAVGAIGAVATSYAGNKAAGATQDASNTAAGVQRDALAQQKELSQPYTELGQKAIPTLENLLGLGPQGAAGAQQTLEQTPGYQFAKTQGLDSTKAAAGSMGMALSGNTLEGLDKFGTGLADQTYGESINRLMGVAGLGQAAAAGQAANIGSGANNLSNIAMQNGVNQANVATGAGASYASIAGNVANAYMTQNTLKAMQPGAQPYTAPSVTTPTYQPMAGFGDGVTPG